MNKTITSYFCLPIKALLCLSLIQFACKKNTDTDTTEEKGFLKTMSFTGSQGGHFLKQTDDGNILLFWTDYADTSSVSHISKIDLNGNIIWKKPIEGIYAGSAISNEQDGSILISTYGNFIKMDKDGNVLINTHPNLKFMGGFPIKVKSSGPLNESYLLSGSDGGSHYSPSLNEVTVIDKFGNESSKSYTLPDSYFNCKVLALNIYRYEDPNTFYFWGYGMLNWAGNWSANPHIFLAKIQLDASDLLISKKIVFIDSTDNTNVNNWSSPTWYHLVNEDKSLVFALNFTNLVNGLSHSRLHKIDSNLNLVFAKNFPFEDSHNAINALEKSSDGGLIVVGKTTGNNSRISIPSYCKYDKSGNLVWKNYLKSPLSGEAWWGIELRKGGYMFTGTTRSFGNGNTMVAEDLFLVKTDNFGNLK